MAGINSHRAEMEGVMSAQEQFGVRLGIATGSRWTWPELGGFWRDVEDMGFDSLWMTDHIMVEGYTTEGGKPVPTAPDVPPPLTPMLEAWTLLGAVAANTQRVMIGTLVTPVTFRHPSMLAKQALTVDQMTNGRFILGLGAGYTEREHRAFGIPYPPAGERVTMTDETLQILRLLETEEHANFQGRYYSLENAPCVPKPVNGHLPLMIGATRPRMLRLTAQYADYYNVAGSYNYVRDRIADLHEHCAAIGRDPKEISSSVGIFIAPVDPLSSLERALHVIERYREAGVDEVIFGASERHRAVVEELGASLGG